MPMNRCEFLTATGAVLPNARLGQFRRTVNAFRQTTYRCCDS